MNLASVIEVVHVLIYVLMFAGNFSFDLHIVWYHAVCSVALLLHWITNNNKCILTEIECRMRNISEDKTLVRAFLSPILQQSELIVVAGTVLGLVLSLLKLYWLCAISPIASPEISPGA